MSETIYLDPAMVPAGLRAGYSGKKFAAHVVTEVSIPIDAGLWSGGSRETYRLVELESGREVPASDNMMAPWDPARREKRIVLRPGFAVVLHSMFCGKDMGLTFYVHPDNAAKLLPAPVAALSAHESLVLYATGAFKSSYMGRDRFEMMREECDPRWTHNRAKHGLADGESFPTRAQWDAAKESLIGKGLLNKAGAITVAGRNARPAR